jgi:hypothetical protein
MSKSNVNPGQYKLAGRERQGEDIAQVRNKQKRAESLVRMRSENWPVYQNPAPVADAESAAAAPAETVEQPAPEPAAPPAKTAPRARVARPAAKRAARRNTKKAPATAAKARPRKAAKRAPKKAAAVRRATRKPAARGAKKRISRTRTRS